MVQPSQACLGIGLRPPHAAALLAEKPPLAFVEVHSENYFGDGGAALAVLMQARAQWPVSLHGVGLSLGSAAGLDAGHLKRLAALVQRVQPLFVSDHACFARAPRGLPAQGPVHAHDLLPVAFTDASLRIMATHVQQVQDHLQRPLLVENISAYLRWADDTMTEPEFFNQLTRQTGCSLLLDVNNLVVNALNHPRNGPRNSPRNGPHNSPHNNPRSSPRNKAAAVRAACEWVDGIDADRVAEIHLAGYHDAGDIVIDDHGSAVHADVWQVYRHAVQRLGPRPTLVEWDTRLPALPVLLAEARRAQALCAPALPTRAAPCSGSAPPA